MNPEQIKYEKMWALTDVDLLVQPYRLFSPGEKVSTIFLQTVKPAPGSTVLDLGCGTGRASLMLVMFGRLKVTMLDFASNSLDESLKEIMANVPESLKFMQADLEQPLTVEADYGFCCDVMEHIPEQNVNAVISNILKATKFSWFQISVLEEAHGELIGEQLHVTVKPMSWWVNKFQELGAEVILTLDGPQDFNIYVKSPAHESRD